jgi:hypothetical protein
MRSLLLILLFITVFVLGERSVRKVAIENNALGQGSLSSLKAINQLTVENQLLLKSRNAVHIHKIVSFFHSSRQLYELSKSWLRKLMNSSTLHRMQCEVEQSCGALPEQTKLVIAKLYLGTSKGNLESTRKMFCSFLNKNK